MTDRSSILQTIRDNKAKGMFKRQSTNQDMTKAFGSIGLSRNSVADIGLKRKVTTKDERGGSKF